MPVSLARTVIFIPAFSIAFLRLSAKIISLILLLQYFIEVIKSIDEQGKLTDELTIAIASAETLAEVEDLYRPFKQKKKTRATIAKAKGLEPLAQIILDNPNYAWIIMLYNNFLDIRELSYDYGTRKIKVPSKLELANLVSEISKIVELSEGEKKWKCRQKQNILAKLEKILL